MIIFSCVRTGETRGIGFLSDARRLNVALTRAKCSLFVIGRASALVQHPLWRELIKDCRDRKMFVEVVVGSFSGFHYICSMPLKCGMIRVVVETLPFSEIS